MGFYVVKKGRGAKKMMNEDVLNLCVPMKRLTMAYLRVFVVLEKMRV